MLDRCCCYRRPAGVGAWDLSWDPHAGVSRPPPGVTRGCAAYHGRSSRGERVVARSDGAETARGTCDGLCCLRGAGADLHGPRLDMDLYLYSIVINNRTAASYSIRSYFRPLPKWVKSS